MWGRQRSADFGLTMESMLGVDGYDLLAKMCHEICALNSTSSDSSPLWV